MDRSVASYPAYATSGIGRTIRDALAEVASLLFASAPFQPRREIEREAHALIEPHLAILVHKRARCLAPAEGPARTDRWAKELDDFVERSFFWPAPQGNEAFARIGRPELSSLVDRIVEAEQRRQAAEKAALPLTSRFDSYWAD
jgi:hypothetical protein